MAKTQSRRVKVQNLRDKWVHLLRDLNLHMDRKFTSFGRIYSQDPLDCGNPQCSICSRDKVFHPKKSRAANRKAERESLKELSESNEN